jgi:hypothetical protein
MNRHLSAIEQESFLLRLCVDRVRLPVRDRRESPVSPNDARVIAGRLGLGTENVAEEQYGGNCLRIIVSVK